MAARAVRNGDGVRHCQVVVVAQRLERREAWREAKGVVERGQVVALVGKRAAELAVGRIAHGHHGGKAVEAAAQQQEHEPAGLPHLGKADRGQGERRKSAVTHRLQEDTAAHVRLSYLHWNAGPASASATRSSRGIELSASMVTSGDPAGTST